MYQNLLYKHFPQHAVELKNIGPEKKRVEFSNQKKSNEFKCLRLEGYKAQIWTLFRMIYISKLLTDSLFHMFSLHILFIFLPRGRVSLFGRLVSALKIKLNLNHFVQSTGCKKSMIIIHLPKAACVISSFLPMHFKKNKMF